MNFQRFLFVVLLATGFSAYAMNGNDSVDTSTNNSSSTDLITTSASSGSSTTK